jgi:hypothetical protein
VRTTTAKLIKYPGHDAWTELFDLQGDPFETKNLFHDPAHAALRARMEAEHQRLVTEVGYRVPEYTDRPDWWGKPGGPDWQPDQKPALRLHFDFTKFDGNRVTDASGLDNRATPNRIAAADGREGRKALRLAGDGCIEVAKSQSLNPSLSAWTIEVVAKTEKPDGVLLAHGGKTQGYALWLKAGRPAFTVTVAGKPVTIAAREPLENWATLTGVITTNHQIQLRVNGQLAADAPLPEFIPNDPRDGMQIGADLGSPVLEPAPPKFTGWIESIRVLRGEPKP